jgi:hypothetical protein
LLFFIMVRPTGTPWTPGIGRWVAGEEEHAISRWRRQFRGEVQVRDDTAITDADIAASNLVLWGDPGSNQVLARIAGRLPIHWTKDAVVIGGTRYPAATHALLLIYPNPLNPEVHSAQQRRHVPRIRRSEQRAAILGCRISRWSTWPRRPTTAGRAWRPRLLRRALGIAPLTDGKRRRVKLVRRGVLNRGFRRRHHA